MTEIPKAITLEGKLRQSWPEYNLATYDLYQNGRKINHESQAVIHKGKHIRSFSDRYQVYPNEKAIEQAEKFASKVYDPELGGLKPYEVKGIPTNPIANLGLHKDNQKSNVYWNRNGTVVYAMYEFEKPFNPDGHDVYLNTVISNSIDGYCPFSAFTSTFRPYCANVFMHMVRAKVLDSLQGVTLESGARVVGDVRGQKLARTTRKHTKNLTDEAVNLSMEQVITSAFNVIEDYKSLRQKELTEQQAQAIFNKMPKRLTSQLDFLELDTEKTKIEKVIGNPTQWDAFNEITNKISHKKYEKTKTGGEFNPRFESVANYMKNTQVIFNLR